MLTFDLMVKLALVGAGVLAGLVVVVLGLRGRRVSSNTFCRACGLDVTKLPSEVVTCPGCQADLTHAASIRYGQRRRDLRVLGLGAAIVLLTLGLGIKSIVWRAGINWPKYMPVWMLLERIGPNDSRASATLQELMIRVRLLEVSDAKTHALVQQALARQADATYPWLTDWGALLEAARVVDKVQPAQWQQYWRRGLALRAIVRTTVRQGSRLPFEVGLGSLRLGDGAANSTCRLKIAALTVDDVPWNQDLQPLIIPLGRDAVDTMHGLAQAPEGVTLTPGNHIAHIVLALQVSGYPDTAVGKLPDPWDTPIALPFHVVAADQPAAVTLVNDPALGALVNKSIFAARGVEVIEEDGRLMLLVKGSYLKLPIDVAARVQVKWGTHPFVPVGYVALRQGIEGGDAWLAKCPLPEGINDQVKAVTLQLVPSAAAAERTLNMTRVWQDPIDLDDHYLYWMTARRPAATAPAAP